MTTLLFDTNRGAQLLERADVRVERAHALGDRLDQAAPLLILVVPLRSQLHDAGVEFARGIFQPVHLRLESGRALGEPRRGRLRFRHPMADAVHGLACRKEPPLRGVQALVGVALLQLDAGDRLARLGLARVELHPLVFGAPALECELLRPAREPRGVLRGTRQLRLEADDGLLVLMQIDGGGADRLLRRDDRVSQCRHARSQRRHRVPFGGNALTQLPDLAFRRENAARLGGRPAVHQVRAAQDVAADGRNRHAALTNRGRRVFVRLRDPRLAQGFADLACVRTRGARHLSERPQPRCRSAYAARRMSLPRPRAPGSRSGPALCSRTSRRPACACSWLRTMTCCSRSPSSASAARSYCAIDIEIVGNRAKLSDGPVGLREHDACGVAVPGTLRIELFERPQPRGRAGQLVLACPKLARERLVFAAGGSQSCLVGGPERVRTRMCGLRLAKSVLGRQSRRRERFALDAEIALLYFQGSQRLRNALARRRSRSGSHASARSPR